MYRLTLWLSVLFIVTQAFAVSYNQPKLCPDATWNPTGIIFANSSSVGTQPMGIFVDIHNTVYVADRSNSRILVWFEGQANPARTISDNLSHPTSIFVTITGDVYVDNGANGRVDKWTSNSANSVTVMSVNSSCNGLFVDINNHLYCSMQDHHQVVKMSLNGDAITPTIVAGTGFAGSASNMLSAPFGIFVDIDLNLYVADFNNDRIQIFTAGQSNGIVVAGNGATETIDLKRPTSVVLDADGYMFIVDSFNHRIVRQGPNGFRCLAGCSKTSGSSLNQLSFPLTAVFDSYGNMFVTDHYNNRIQKFILATNICNSTSTTQKLSTSSNFTVTSTRVNRTTIRSTTSTSVHQTDRRTTDQERNTATMTRSISLYRLIILLQSLQSINRLLSSLFQ